ncbi:Com family DNA-binding transcriptional regulator [Caulobacter sp. ErkDOM-YI]
MKPLRCRSCGRLLARQAVDASGEIEVACPRCKAVNQFG